MFLIFYFVGFSIHTLVPCIGALNLKSYNVESNKNKNDNLRLRRNWLYFGNSNLVKNSKRFKVHPDVSNYATDVSPDIYSDSQDVPYSDPNDEDSFTKNLINSLTHDDELLLKGSRRGIETESDGSVNNAKIAVSDFDKQQSQHSNVNKDNKNLKENFDMQHNEHNSHYNGDGLSNILCKGNDGMIDTHYKRDINKCLYLNDKTDQLSENMPSVESPNKNDELKYYSTNEQNKLEDDHSTDYRMQSRHHNQLKDYSEEENHREKLIAEKYDKSSNKFENQFLKDENFAVENFFENKQKSYKEDTNYNMKLEDESKHNHLNSYAENPRFQSSYEKDFSEYHTKENEDYLAEDQRHRTFDHFLENEDINSDEHVDDGHRKAVSSTAPLASMQKEVLADKRFMANPNLDNTFLKHSIGGEILEEYRHYPNEYLTKEESLTESERNVNQIKDAVKLDAEGLKSELSAINEEDERIGSIFEKKNQNRESREKYETTEGREDKADVLQSHKDKSKTLPSNPPEEESEMKRISLINKKIDDDSKKVDDYEEFDKETKELLNIDVRANGKIVDTNGQHPASKEEVFDKENIGSYFQTPLNSSNLLKNYSASSEVNSLLKEINDLQNELETANLKSEESIKTFKNLKDFDGSHLIVKKTLFSKMSDAIEKRNAQTKKGVPQIYFKNNFDNENSASSARSQHEIRAKRNAKEFSITPFTPITPIKRKATTKKILKKYQVKVKSIIPIIMDSLSNEYQSNRSRKEVLTRKPKTKYGVTARISTRAGSRGDSNVHSTNDLSLKRQITPRLLPSYRKRNAIEKSKEGRTLQIVVKSIGCFDPPFHGSNCDATLGSIIVNGAEVSPNRPGFNIVVIDFKTGEVEQATSFDTHGEAGAFKKLENMLSNLEMWKIICIAVKNDAESYLPDSALHSFERIGAQGIAVQKIEYRSSYAFVGLSGPENARNKMNWLREESTRAGDGPSIISVHIKTGLDAFEQAGGRNVESKIQIPARFHKTSFGHGYGPVEIISTNQESKDLLDDSGNESRFVQKEKEKERLFLADKINFELLRRKNKEENISPDTSFSLPDTLATERKFNPVTSMPDSSKTISKVIVGKPENMSAIELQIRNLQIALAQEKQNYENIVKMALKQNNNNPINLNPASSLNQNSELSFKPTYEPSPIQQTKPQSSLIESSTSLPTEDVVDKQKQGHNQAAIDYENVLTILKSGNQFNEEETAKKGFDIYSERLLDNAAKKLIQSFKTSAAKESLSKYQPVERFTSDNPLSKLSNAFAVLDGSGAVNEAGISRLDELLKGSEDMSSIKLKNNFYNSLKNVALSFPSQTTEEDATSNKSLPSSLISSILLALGKQAVSGVTKNYEKNDNFQNDKESVAKQAVGDRKSEQNINDKILIQSILSGLVQDLIPSKNHPDLQSFKKNTDTESQFEMIGSLGSNISPGAPNPAYDSSLEKEERTALTNHNFYATANTDTQYTGQGPIGSISQTTFEKNHDYSDTSENSSAIDSSLIKQIIEKIPPETVQKLVILFKDKVTKEMQLKIHSPPSLESKPDETRYFNKAKLDDSCMSPLVAFSKTCINDCNDKETLIGRYINLQSSETKAVIKINGQDWSKDEDGFNLVVLDFLTGEVEATESFDTAVDGGASRAMTSFIISLAPGKIVLAATRGNAGELMGNTAYTALAYIGAMNLFNNHLNNGDRYVLLGATGDLRAINQEDLVQYGNDIAEIKAPIVIGPGAMNDTCLCLKSCEAKEDFKSFKDESNKEKSGKAYDLLTGHLTTMSGVVEKRVQHTPMKLSEIKNKVNGEEEESDDGSFVREAINTLLSSESSDNHVKSKLNENIQEKTLHYESDGESESEASGYAKTAEKKSGNLKKLASLGAMDLKLGDANIEHESTDSTENVVPTAFVEKEAESSSGNDEISKAEIILLRQNKKQTSSKLRHNQMKGLTGDFANQENLDIALGMKDKYQSKHSSKKLVDNIIQALHSVKTQPVHSKKVNFHKNSFHSLPIVKEQGLSLLSKYNINFLSSKKKSDERTKKKEKQAKKKSFDDVYSTIGNNLHSR